MDAIVIVGASLAGLRAAQAVRKGGHEGDLVVVGEEEHGPYTRPPLSKELLAGDHEPAQCDFDHAGVDAQWRFGERATALDADARRVTLASGEELAYGRLIVATGAAARQWGGPGAGLAGIHTLRDVDDALALRDALTEGTRLAVVGAGFVGCEVAATAVRRGADVTLLDVAPQPIAPVGAEVGLRCAELHAGHGVQVRLGCGIAGFSGDERLESVELADGTSIAADVAVVALGAVPNTAWLEGSGLTLELGGGVLCDATLTAVGAPDVLCAGDVTSWPHPLAGGDVVRVEHWTNAAEQGGAAGRNALLDPADRAPYEAVPYFWTDQYDVKLQAVGFPARAEQVHVLERDADRFVVVGEHDGRAVSAVAWNAPRRLMLYRRALAGAPTVHDLREQLADTDKALAAG